MLRLSAPVASEYGKYPSVAYHRTKNIAVCAYESTLGKSMFYRVGTVGNAGIQWGVEQKDNNSGEYVKIEILERGEKLYVLAVYSSVFFQRCYYKYNEIDVEKKEVRFAGRFYVFGSGVRPTLAMRNDGVVVIVTEKPNSSTLMCHLGQIDNIEAGIRWNKRYPLDVVISGTTPSVAINDTHVILFYRSSLTFSLKYACGTLAPDNINWSVRGQVFSSGIRPNVTMNNGGEVVIAHMSSTGRKLYFSSGRVDDRGFTLVCEPNQLGTGMNPAVSLSSNDEFIEVHGSDYGLRLWVSLGGKSEIRARNWDEAEEVEEVEEVERG